ncbi:hypothetical protein RHMOL_Rhmol06G0010100 [Rhododendron molle]|uniref:Uncharacterized protein n=1 Tax=Rhododendron molle TaxID=49168 RepID=A0ACC0N7C6_RHOML|nr:hypothetical protein RHMOL_Rhmol06G0010100 [Rhododendron molle]
MLAAARAMDGGTSSVYLIMMKLVSLLLRLVTTVVDAATPVDWVTINVRETGRWQEMAISKKLPFEFEAIYSTQAASTKPRTAAMLESGSSSGRSRSSYYDSSNSFYSELAIRECLEFIKMSTSSSLSSDHQEAIDR